MKDFHGYNHFKDWTLADHTFSPGSSCNQNHFTTRIYFKQSYKTKNLQNLPWAISTIMLFYASGLVVTNS